MLVLSRKIGQEIVIGREVSIRVLEVCGNRVRVGISAPQAVIVHREEVHRQINLSMEASNCKETAANERRERDGRA